MLSISKEFEEDIDPEIIDLFNKKFKTNYLAPITYDFEKDYKIADKINILKPIINFNSDSNLNHKDIIYRISKWGLNPYDIGLKTNFTK